MRVELDNGTVIDLGDLETAPTIGITDYSRRETDDFGVTTVVERGFARRMSVRLKVAFDEVDALQRQLAALRAVSALWVADDALASLSVRGFFKDFSIDLNVPPVSFCTLTIEGLAETEGFTDPGGDPAVEGKSTLRLLQPIALTSAMLTASSVPENDAPEWAAGTTYAMGALVMKAATHRVYESAANQNVGNDPAGNSGKWFDIGPTNRWAMFDQALGSATVQAGSIVVTIAPGAPVDAVALLDTSGSTVRVVTAGYERMQAVGNATQLLFDDLPGGSGPVTITIAASGDAAVGTLLIGKLVGLGVTEAAPTAGITDYSRKETDAFGEVTVVERAWAKRMNVRALIGTDGVDRVAARIAAVRARPCLWVGQAGLETLSIYGFFKDFSIEVGEHVSALTLSVEGLSTAGKVAPLIGDVAWPDITDPDGTKPEDNATNGAPGDSPFGDETAQASLDAMRVGLAAQALEALRGGAFRVEQETRQDHFLQILDQMGVDLGDLMVFISFLREVDQDGNAVWALTAQNSNGAITGIRNLLTKEGLSKFAIAADIVEMIDPNGGNPVRPFYYGLDNILRVRDLLVEGNLLVTGSVNTLKMQNNAVSDADTATLGSPVSGNGSWGNRLSYTLTIPSSDAGAQWTAIAIVTASQGFPDGDRDWDARLVADGVQLAASGGQKSEDNFALSGRATWGPGSHTFSLEWKGQSGATLAGANMVVLWLKR